MQLNFIGIRSEIGKWQRLSAMLNLLMPTRVIPRIFYLAPFQWTVYGTMMVDEKNQINICQSLSRVFLSSDFLEQSVRGGCLCFCFPVNSHSTGPVDDGGT